MEDWLHRIYEDMIERISGPMKFRLVLLAVLLLGLGLFLLIAVVLKQ